MNNCENEEIAMVQTCGVCETICYLVEVSNHECLKGYGCYVDAATRYFYPLLSIYFIFYKCILFCCAYISKLNIFFIYDGKTCLRRTYINGVEQIVEAEIDATFSQDILVAGNCQLANSSCQSEENIVKNVGSKTSKVPSKRKASKKLSLEEEEHLILAVQNRKPLWDISQPVDQRSRETRKRLWCTRRSCCTAEI